MTSVSTKGQSNPKDAAVRAFADGSLFVHLPTNGPVQHTSGFERALAALPKAVTGMANGSQAPKAR